MLCLTLDTALREEKTPQSPEQCCNCGGSYIGLELDAQVCALTCIQADLASHPVRAAASVGWSGGRGDSWAAHVRMGRLMCQSLDCRIHAAPVLRSACKNAAPGPQTKQEPIWRTH